MCVGRSCGVVVREQAFERLLDRGTIERRAGGDSKTRVHACNDGTTVRADADADADGRVRVDGRCAHVCRLLATAARACGALHRSASLVAPRAWHTLSSACAWRVARRHTDRVAQAARARRGPHRLAAPRTLCARLLACASSESHATHRSSASRWSSTAVRSRHPRQQTRTPRCTRCSHAFCARSTPTPTPSHCSARCVAKPNETVRVCWLTHSIVTLVCHAAVDLNAVVVLFFYIYLFCDIHCLLFFSLFRFDLVHK